jgi:hypothetical protein
MEDAMKRRALIQASAAGAALLAAALLLVPSRPETYPPTMSRDDIICRGQSGVGFSYWWGGECWCRSGCSPNYGCGRGECVRTGSSGCPSQCYHTGSYGADCSGFVSKCWQVPNAVSTEACHTDRYTASSFHGDHSYWDIIPRSSARRGDAMASTTHVVLFESFTSWGSHNVYEARGCWTPGIVHQTNSLSSSFTTARRINISDCACTPGQTDTQACGNCGTKTRTCQSNCQWGDFSACTGQGPCSPGATESRSCCDCGSQSRTCKSNCEWGGWSDCAGPDPDGGTRVCDTGECGPCAEGRVRCIEGCTQCVRLTDPVEEMCDDIDNDCNCSVDDGYPTIMGASPPAYGAELHDFSYPSVPEPGQASSVWAEFRNVGTEPWLPGDVWLSASQTDEGDVSPLYHEDSWRSWDVPSVVDEDVAPGESVLLTFTILAPLEADGPIDQEFVLLGPSGDMIKCPVPNVVMTMTLAGYEGSAAGNGDSEDGAGAAGPGLDGACACSIVY